MTTTEELINRLAKSKYSVFMKNRYSDHERIAVAVPADMYATKFNSASDELSSILEGVVDSEDFEFSGQMLATLRFDAMPKEHADAIKLFLDLRS